VLSEQQKIPDVRYSERIQDQLLAKHIVAQQDKSNEIFGRYKSI
jgi:hypothetical protein